MSAECFACSVGVQQQSHTGGSKIGNPLGACLTCHAFACRAHGDRNASAAKFQCVMCTLGLLGQSAGALTDDGDFEPDEREFVEDLRDLPRRRPNRDEAEFVDGPDFLAHFPGFASMISDHLQGVEWGVSAGAYPTPVERALKKMPQSALDLLGIAKTLRDVAKVPPEQVSPTLNAAFGSLGMGLIA